MTLDQIEASIEAAGFKPYYKDEDGLIYNADCLEMMKAMPDKCVNLVLTDPPYGVKKAGWDNEYNNDWVGMASVVLMEDATLISFCGTRQSPYLAMEIDQYFTERQHFIWICPDKHFYSPRHLIIKTEEAHIGRRGKPFFQNNQKCFDYLIYNVETELCGHPTQKPRGLFRRLVTIFCSADDFILDPYLGSGTTAVAAKQLGRKYIGIEICEEYCRTAVDRLRQRELFNENRESL